MLESQQLTRTKIQKILDIKKNIRLYWLTMRK